MILGLLDGEVLGKQRYGIDYALVFDTLIIGSFGQLIVEVVETLLHVVDMRKRLADFLQKSCFIGQFHLLRKIADCCIAGYRYSSRGGML